MLARKALIAWTLAAGCAESGRFTLLADLQGADTAGADTAVPVDADGAVDVIVVGGGLAGLAAVHRLRRQAPELEVVLYEARDRLGGRVYNQPLGDTYAEAGGQYVGPGQEAILTLVDELGLDTFTTYSAGDAVILRDGERLVGPAGPPAAVGLAVQTLAQRWAALAGDLDPARPWADPRAVVWDDASLADWLDEELEDTPEAEAVRAEVRRVVGRVLASEPDDLSLLFWLAWLKGAGGWSAATEQARSQRIAGGAGAVVQALGEALDDAVRIGTPVEQVEWSTEGVRAQLPGDRIVQAEVMIVAMSPSAAGRIPFRPTLPATRSGLQGAWPDVGRRLKVSASYPTPFWREDGLSGTAASDRGAVRFVFDNTPADGAPGVLTAYADRSALAGTAEDRAAVVVDDLVALFGAEAAQPLATAELDWALEPGGTGCVVALPPGLLTRWGAALRAPVGPLHWAGSESSALWAGTMDGAVRSGIRAADEVLARRAP